MRSGNCRSGRMRPQWWLVAAACLMASLLPVTSAGAAEEPADAGESASDTEDPAGGVQVVRYAALDRYAMSIELAQALVDAEGGTSEWVVLASGESWADAAAAGPLAASLSAPVVLVPSGGLQALSAPIEFAELLRSAGVRRVMIVGSGIVLPDHKQSVLYGLGMLPRDVERLHGTDAVANSIAVAERIGTAAEFGDLGRTVIIASDHSVADAVAVGPLAAAGPFPLLLTAPDALDPRITAYLTDHEIEHVVLVGGAADVSAAVQEAIETTDVTVTRLAGQDRFHTAALAMDLLAEVPRCTDDEIDSIGLALADEPRLALAAGHLLGPQCIPLLFTDADRLAPITQNHLYLYRHRTGIAPNWHLIGDGVSIDPSAIERPPVRMATVADNPDGDGQHIVVLDEQHQARHYLTDAGFDGITRLRWAPDRETVIFTGVRNGTPLLYGDWKDGQWVDGEGVDGGTRSTYELDLHSGAVRPQPRIQSWYAPLILDGWVDPTPSPGREYIVFRAPTEDYAGHSLFTLHVESGEVRQLTHNTTNDTHHVVSSGWLADGRRLIYAHFDISQYEEPVSPDGPSNTHGYLGPDTRLFDSRCENTPLHRAHIVDVGDGRVWPLSHGNHLVDKPVLLSPDRRFVAIKSYEDYEFAPERDIHGFFRWRCSHDGVGTPSISVFDITGAEPRAVTEDSASGFVPTWSPDSDYLVFRTSTEDSGGHSLFALDVAAGDVAQMTHNQSDEHHHVAQSWILNGNKLLYTVQRIDELDGPCHHVSPAQGRRSGVPHLEAHVVSLSDRRSTRLAYEGFIVSDYDRAGIDVPPNGTQVSFETNSFYDYYTAQGGCSYHGRNDLRFYLYDVSADEPQSALINGSSASGALWSPNGRYLHYTNYEFFQNPSNSGYDNVGASLLDTASGAVWQVPLSQFFGPESTAHAVAWTPDSSRLLYRVGIGARGNRTHGMTIADITSDKVVPLELPQVFEYAPRYFGFSPDSQQVIHSDWATAGTVLLHDTRDGALLGIYDIYAATEPGKPVLNDPDDYGDILKDFRFSAEWTTAGIFTAGEYYLWPYYDY